MLERLMLQVAVLQEQIVAADRHTSGNGTAGLPTCARTTANTAIDLTGNLAEGTITDPLLAQLWHGQRPVPATEFVGVKAGSDLAGRAMSNCNHYMHRQYVKHVDYLCIPSDEGSKRARSALGYCEPTDSNGIPDHHRWEDYIKSLMDYHTRLAKMDHPAFHGITDESKQRILRVVLIVCRCRWFYGLTHGMARCGGDTTTWKDTYAMMKHIYRSEIELTDYTPFDQFFPKLVEEQMRLLRGGDDPNLSDSLQDQINAAARGRVSNYLAARGSRRDDRRDRNDRPDDDTRPAQHCALCGSNAHMADNHPANKPITIPCKICGDRHYRKVTPCKAKSD